MPTNVHLPVLLFFAVDKLRRYLCTLTAGVDIGHGVEVFRARQKRCGRHMSEWTERGKRRRCRVVLVLPAIHHALAERAIVIDRFMYSEIVLY